MITTENKNFLRIILLLYDAASFILRHIVVRELEKHGGDLDNLLTKDEFKNKLKHKLHFGRSQVEKLFPSNGKSDIKTWDSHMLAVVSLLIFRSTLSSDEKYHIKFIKLIRNNVAHKSSASYFEDDFDDEKDDPLDSHVQLAVKHLEEDRNNGELLRQILDAVNEKHDIVRKDIQDHAEKIENNIHLTEKKICESQETVLKSLNGLCLDIGNVESKVTESKEKSSQELKQVNASLTNYIVNEAEKVSQKVDSNNSVLLQEVTRNQNEHAAKLEAKLKVGTHTYLTVDGPTQEWINTVETVLKSVFDLLLNKVQEPGQNPETERAVKAFLNFIKDFKDVELKAVERKCILLAFECWAYESLRELIEFINSYEFHKYLDSIARALKKDLKIAQKLVISSEIPVSSLQLLVDDKSSSMKRESKKGIELSFECTSIGGLDAVWRLFVKGKATPYINNIAAAVSSEVGETTSLSTSVNLPDFEDSLKLLEAAVNKEKETAILKTKSESKQLCSDSKSIDSDLDIDKVETRTDDSNLYIQDQAEVTKPDPFQPVYTPEYAAMQSERGALKEHLQSLLQSRYKQNIYDKETVLACSGALAEHSPIIGDTTNQRLPKEDFTEQSSIIGETSHRRLTKGALEDQSSIIGETDQRLTKEALEDQSSIIGKTSDRRLTKEALEDQSSIIGETDQRLPKGALEDQSSIIGETSDRRLTKEALAEPSSIIGETDQRLPKGALEDQSSIIGEISERRLSEEALAEPSSIIGETDQRLPKEDFTEQSSIIGETSHRRLTKGALEDQSSIIGETDQRLTKEALEDQSSIIGKTSDRRLTKEALEDQSSIIGETDQRLPKGALEDQSSIIGETSDRRLTKEALAEPSSIIGETDQRLPKGALEDQSSIIGEISERRLSEEALAEPSSIIGETDQRLPKEDFTEQSSIIGETSHRRLPKGALEDQSSIIGETDQLLPKEALADQSSIIGETDQRLPKKALEDQSLIVGENSDRRLPKEALAEQSAIIGETDQRQPKKALKVQSSIMVLGETSDRRLPKEALAEQSAIIRETTNRRAPKEALEDQSAITGETDQLLSKEALAEKSSVIGETERRLSKGALPEQSLISGKTDNIMPKIWLTEYSKSENSGTRQLETASALVMNLDRHPENLTEQAQRSYSRPYDYISLIYQKEVPLHGDFNALSTISSCAILSNGRLMIADDTGLSVVNIHTGFVEQKKTLDTSYSDITVLPNDQVAVALPWKGKIVILSAHDMSLIRSIATKNCPFGITFHEDEVYVVCFPYDKLPYVNILNLQSALCRKIKCDKLTFYPYTRIAVSMDAQNLYITGSKSLIRYSAHGQVIAKYRCIETHPKALTLLDDGSLLVVSERIDYIHTIHHISADLLKGYELKLGERSGRFIGVDSVKNGIYLISKGTINVYYMQKQDSQWQFDKKLTSGTTNEKLLNLTAEKKLPSVKTDEKLDIFKAETKEKVALLKAETGFPSLQYDEELPFLEDDEELPSLKTYILSPFKAAKRLFSANTNEKITSFKAEKEFSFAKTDDKVIPFKAEKKLPFAKTEEKITSFKAEKKLPFAKTDERITSFKTEKKLSSAESHENLTFFTAEKKTICQSDEIGTNVKESTCQLM